MSYLDPPPNNAGISTTGRHLSFAGAGSSAPVPKKKTLEFENMNFTYDYAAKTFLVEGYGGKSLEFSEEDLAELKAALLTFGIGLSAGDGVTCR